MSQDDFNEMDALVAALRADVPSAREQERARLRLMAAGVLVVSAAMPAGATAASGASVAGGAWAAKLAAAGWTTKLAVVAVAGAVVAAPAALLVLSASAPVEEGLRVASARQHARVAALVAARVSEDVTTSLPAPGSELAASAVQDVERGRQLIAANASRPSSAIASRTPPKSAQIKGVSSALEQVSGVVQQQPTAAGLPARPSTGLVGDMTPAQATAASNGPRSMAATSSAATASASSASGVVVASSQLTAATPDAPVTHRLPSSEPSDEAMAPQPSAADEPATRFYAGRELTRPQLAGVRQGPASELARETQLIERALAALRVDDVPAARSWLKLHAARYPDGLLSRDRERVLQRIEESARARRAGRASAEHERQ